ncbi:hypothetical protein ABK040_010147 [Willaertia magna]
MTNRCILNIYLSNGKGFCAFPSSSLTTIDELITFLEREYERYYPSDDSIKIKNIQYLDLTDKENPVKYEILSDWESLDINQNNKTNNKMLEYLFGKNAFLYLEVDKYNTGTTFDIVSPVPGSMRTRKIVEIDQPLLSFDSDTVQSNNDSIIFVDEDGEDSIFEKALKEHEEGRQHDVMQEEEERTEVFPSPEVEQPKEEEKQIEEKQETKEDIVNNENLEQQKEEDEVMKEQQLEQQKQPKEEKQDTEVPINRNSTTSVNTNVVTEQLSEDEITIVIDDEETTEDEKEEEPKNQQGITTIASSNQTTQTKPPSPIMDEVMSEHEEDNNNTESSKLLLAPVSQLFTQPISSSPLNKVKSPTSSISSSLESSIPLRTEDEPLVISQKAKEKLLGLSQETKRKGVDTATPPKKITFPKTPQPTSSSSQNSENSPTAKSTSKVTKQKKMYSELGKAPIAKKLQWIKQAVQKVKPNNDTKK